MNILRKWDYTKTEVLIEIIDSILKIVILEEKDELKESFYRTAIHWLPIFIVRFIDPLSYSIEKFIESGANEISKGTFVLDAGAGESRFANYFNEQIYVGVDSCKGDKKWDYSKIDVIADLERLPFQSDVFGFCYLYSSS